MTSHNQPETGLRPLSQILNLIADEALASGDQPILALVEEASDLIDLCVETDERRHEAQRETLIDLLAALIAGRDHARDLDNLPQTARVRVADPHLVAALRRPEVDLAGALDRFLARIEQRLDPAPGPDDQVYETTIVVWSEFNPEQVELDDLAREACRGDAICTFQHTRRCSVALAPDDARSFFGIDEGDDRCEGCGRRDIASCPCLVCETCLSSYPGSDGQAREAGWTIQRDTPTDGAPHGALRRVKCNGNGPRASSACQTRRARPPVTLAPLTEPDRAVIAPWLEDPDAQRWAGGAWLAEPASDPSPAVPEGAVFLARSDSEPVAVISASPGVASTVVALVVDPARRGEGIGTSTLEALAGLQQYRDSLLSGEIAATNVASRLAFAHAGFTERDPGEDGYITLVRDPEPNEL
jgi:GNAT superfamily N-acetyltransferase